MLRYGRKIRNGTKNITSVLNQMYCKGTVLAEPWGFFSSFNDNCNNLNISVILQVMFVE
jgi:hypothetical protein